jgi:hypothetical protein
VYIVERSRPREAAAAILALLADGKWHAIPVSHRGHRRAEYITGLVDHELGPDRTVRGHWDYGDDAFFGERGFTLRLRAVDRPSPDRYIDKKFVPDAALGGSAFGPSISPPA